MGGLGVGRARRGAAMTGRGRTGLKGEVARMLVGGGGKRIGLMGGQRRAHRRLSSR